MVQQLINNYKIERTNRSCEIVPQHISLDKGYDSNKIRSYLQKKRYIPHIPYRRRNNGIVQNMTQEELEHYSSRITIERYFGILKQYKAIVIRYQRKIEHYISLIDIANINILGFRL